jgi:predicted ester cyclase
METFVDGDVRVTQGVREGVALFVEERGGEVIEHVDRGLLFAVRGAIPDPRTKGGRLRLVARHSWVLALRVIVNTVLRARVAAPLDLGFVAPPAGTSAVDAVRRHFDAENAHDAARTTRTMVGEEISHRGAGTGESNTTRAQVYAGYSAIFAAFPDATFTPRFIGANADQSRVLAIYDFDGHHLGTLSGIPATGRRIQYTAPILFEVAPGGGIMSETSYASACDILTGMGIDVTPRV